MGVSILLFILFSFFLFEAQSGETEALRLEYEPFVYTNWNTFYEQDGLPNNHIFALKTDDDRLWAGTENGLALFENNTWKSWTEEDGLPWRVISSIAVSSKTGDVWIGMLGGGVARFSGGSFEHFNQLNSGLVNDVVYGVAVEQDTLWAATAAGTSSYNTVTREWEIYTDKNAPMEEIWCYNVEAYRSKVYLAVWGGGVLIWDTQTKQWNAHRDPDHEMEIDLYRDDGLIHNITTAVSLSENVMWVSTYFGLSRYYGRHWRGYMDHDSGLASNFINHVKASGKDSCFVATDQGLSALMDFNTDTWVTYQRLTDDAACWDAGIYAGKNKIKSVPTNLNLPNHFVICVEIQGDDIWIGTGHGLARGNGAKK